MDIDPVNNLALVEDIMETCENFKGVIDIEITTFLQSSLMAMSGMLELFDEMLSQG